MKVKIIGNTFVVTSTLSAQDIVYLAKNAPDKLKLKEKDDGNELFAVSYNEAHPSIQNFGIVFGGKTRDEKELATVTGTIPTGMSDADAKAFVADKVSAAFGEHYEKLAKSISSEAKKMREVREKLVESISIEA